MIDYSPYLVIDYYPFWWGRVVVVYDNATESYHAWAETGAGYGRLPHHAFAVYSTDKDDAVRRCHLDTAHWVKRIRAAYVEAGR